MVPSAGEADLDDVKSDVVGLGKLFQLSWALEGPTLRGKRPSEGEQHIDELRLVADRAVGLRRLTQAGCNPQ